MLHLHLGAIEREEIYGERYVADPSIYFELDFDPTWLTTEATRKILKDIEGTEIVNGVYVVTKYFGFQSPYFISNGAKNLILLEHADNVVINGECLGDNCWRYVYEIGSRRDIYVCLNHLVHSEDIDEPIEFFLENTGEVWEGSYMDYFWLCYDTFEETREVYWAKRGVQYKKPPKGYSTWEEVYEKYGKGNVHVSESPDKK